MAREIIDSGTGPNVGDGEEQHEAWNKVNRMTDELYLATTGKADVAALHDGAAQDTAIGLKADQTALNTEIASTNTEQTTQDGRLTALEAAPSPLVDAVPIDASVNAVSSNGVFDAFAAATTARGLLVSKSDKADTAAVIAGTIDRWVDAAELKVAIDALDFAGDYQGSAATFAGLPASPTSGDWAILNVDDGPNLSGVYVTDGATYSLAKAIPDFVAGVLANFISTDGDFAVPKSWSGQVLESWRHSNENFTTLADGGTAEAGTGRSVDPGSTIAAPTQRIDGAALVTGDYFQLALTADGAVTVTGVAETTTFTGLQASSHAWYYTGATWVDLDPQISDLLTQAEIDDSASTEEGTVTGALLHAALKPDIIVNTQVEADTASVLDGQRIQIGRGSNYLATYENISGLAQLADGLNRSDGNLFAPLHRWRGSMLGSDGAPPLIDDSNLYFSDWTVGVPPAPTRERSHYFVGVVQATEAAWDGTQKIQWSYFQSMEDPGSPGDYIWVQEILGNTANLNFRYIAESVDSGAAAEQEATWIDGVSWPAGEPNDLLLWNEDVGTFKKGDVYRCIRSTIGLAPDWEKWISVGTTQLERETIGVAGNVFTVNEDRYSWLSDAGVTPGDTIQMPAFSAWNGFTDERYGIIDNISGIDLTITLPGGYTGTGNIPVVLKDSEVLHWRQTGPTHVTGYVILSTASIIAPVPAGYEIVTYTGTMPGINNGHIAITIPAGKFIFDYKLLVNYTAIGWLDPGFYTGNASYGGAVLINESIPSIQFNSMGTVLLNKPYRLLVTFAN